MFDSSGYLVDQPTVNIQVSSSTLTVLLDLPCSGVWSASFRFTLKSIALDITDVLESKLRDADESISKLNVDNRVMLDTVNTLDDTITDLVGTVNELKDTLAAIQNPPKHPYVSLRCNAAMPPNGAIKWAVKKYCDDELFEVDPSNEEVTIKTKGFYLVSVRGNLISSQQIPGSVKLSINGATVAQFAMGDANNWMRSFSITEALDLEANDKMKVLVESNQHNHHMGDPCNNGFTIVRLDV